MADFKTRLNLPPSSVLQAKRERLELTRRRNKKGMACGHPSIVPTN
jgi:hypothetical protein